jgi:hypothetical protein
MQLQTNNQGEALPKRKGRRMRKHEWREKWIVMTEGATLTDRTIKQLMRGPKLLSNAMPRVMSKNPKPPRSADSEFGLKRIDRAGHGVRPPKDKYLFNKLISNLDGVAVIAKTPVLNKNSEEVYAVAKARNHAQAMREVKAFDRIGTS